MPARSRSSQRKSRPATRTPEQVELERARKKIARLEDDLAKHRLAWEIQGKASELLERLLIESDETNRRQP
jgi:transposase